VTYQTGLIANRVIREVLTGIAMRKKGITEPYYFADEAIDGGQGQDWPQRRSRRAPRTPSCATSLTP